MVTQPSLWLCNITFNQLTSYGVFVTLDFHQIANTPAATSVRSVCLTDTERTQFNQSGDCMGACVTTCVTY